MNDQTVKSGPIPKSSNWQPATKTEELAPPVARSEQSTAARPEVDPSRERQPREETHTNERRRRKGGNLNRMVQFKLDFIPPEYLDLDTYVYRWVNDEGGKLRMATRHDDYDHVTVDELKGFDPEGFDTEGGETIRMLVGESKHGGALYAYLLKKRRAFWEADNEEVVRSREDMMAGRVYRAELADDESEIRDENYQADNYYASKDNQIGGAAARRKGPLPKRAIR